jgi:hypothetical protein
MPIPCARCEMPLSRWEPDTGTAMCRLCGSNNSVRAFPAMLATASAARPESAMEGEAACFDHPGKRAVAACSQCGRYVCGLCSVDYATEPLPAAERRNQLGEPVPRESAAAETTRLVWCPSCVSTRAGRAQAANLETSRMLYDSIALTLPLASLIMWPFTIVAAPAALVISIAKWKAPRSLVRRTRWRLVTAIVISSVEIVAWVWGIAYILTRSTRGPGA